MSDEELLWTVGAIVALAVTITLLILLVQWWNRRRLREACSLITKLCEKHYCFAENGRVIDTEPDDLELQHLDWAMDIVASAEVEGNPLVGSLLNVHAKSWARRKLAAWDC